MFKSVKPLSITRILIFLVAFAAVVALLGGSSNPRVAQLAGLRPLAALFLIPIIYYWQGAKSDQERTLVALLTAFTGWMLVQIIPLPQALWGQLPDRQLIVELDALLGLEGQWRPISWVPSRGWNALAAMIVPACALFLAVALRAKNTMLLQILLGATLLNSMLMIVQIISGNADALYFYDPGSNGSDGLFANENHSGVFSAIGLLIGARLALQTNSREQPWRQLAHAAAMLTIFLAVLIGGSRAGLAAGAGAFIGSIVMLILSTDNAKSRTNSVIGKLGNRTLLVIMGVFLVGLAAFFFWLDRSSAFDGILSKSAFEDLRWELTPVIWEMIGKNWLLGIGFGAFEEYYHIYEPTPLLGPSFVNMAHNDWLQLILEGGVVVVLLLAAMIVWIVRQLGRLFTTGPSAFALILFWVAIIGIISSASLVDYPLRTPIFQLMGVWLLLCLARDGENAASGARSAMAQSGFKTRKPKSSRRSRR